MRKSKIQNLTPDDLRDIATGLKVIKKIKDNPRLMFDGLVKVGAVVLEKAIEKLDRDIKQQK